MFCINCGKEQTGSPAYCYECSTKLVQIQSLQPYATHTTAANYVGFWRRLGAAIIDLLVIHFISSTIFVFIGNSIGVVPSPDERELEITGLQIVFAYVWWVTTGVLFGLYCALMEMSSKQATLGKMAVKVIVTDMEGRRISFEKAIVRNIGKYISALLLLVGFIMIAFTEKKQGLHDIFAETLVIKK